MELESIYLFCENLLCKDSLHFTERAGLDCNLEGEKNGTNGTYIYAGFNITGNCLQTLVLYMCIKIEKSWGG